MLFICSFCWLPKKNQREGSFREPQDKSASYSFISPPSPGIAAAPSLPLEGWSLGRPAVLRGNPHAVCPTVTPGASWEPSDDREAERLGNGPGPKVLTPSCLCRVEWRRGALIECCSSYLETHGSTLWQKSEMSGIHFLT